MTPPQAGSNPNTLKRVQIHDTLLWQVQIQNTLLGQVQIHNTVRQVQIHNTLIRQVKIYDTLLRQVQVVRYYVYTLLFVRVVILHIFLKKSICGTSEKNKIIITIWQL